MNSYLLIASGLMVILALAHSVLGEIKIFKHLNDEGLPVVMGIPVMWKTAGSSKRTLRFVWHITSILGLGFSAILYYFGNLAMLDAKEIMVVKITGVTMILSGIIAGIISKGSHLGWILFFAIGIFCLMGIW